TSGLLLPGGTVISSLSDFTIPYDIALNAIGATHAQAVLVGLPHTGRRLAALRLGSEIWADRAEFAALNVEGQPDCDGSQNYINVSIKSLIMAFEGAQRAQIPGAGSAKFSCADIPFNGQNVQAAQDQVLTPDDMNTLDGLLTAIDNHIREQAAARGYAYFSL